MLVFDEIYVRGPKLVYKHIQVGKVWPKSPRTNQGSLRKDLSFEPKLPKSSLTYEGQPTPHRWSDAP